MHQHITFMQASFSFRVANLLVIVLMVVVFILAVVLPFPGGRRADR